VTKKLEKDLPPDHVVSKQCVAFPGAYSGSEYAPKDSLSWQKGQLGESSLPHCWRRARLGNWKPTDCISRFLAFSVNAESDRHEPRRSLLLLGRRRNDSVTPGEREGYKLDRAAWFLLNFLTVSSIDAV
jgi:hypothetical protein